MLFSCSIKLEHTQLDLLEREKHDLILDVQERVRAQTVSRAVKVAHRFCKLRGKVRGIPIDPVLDFLSPNEMP